MQDEIKSDQWTEFLRVFSERNQARPTRLETFGELGAQEQERHLPFGGISFDSKAKTLQIMLGGSTAKDARHLMHTITQVRRVFTKQGADGGDEALEIEDANGVKTLLQFEVLVELTAGQ
jgi:Family of unknown function (DUF5335)